MEDLLVPFSCTSTDIAGMESKMHREGPIWRVVRASMSLVGFVPPLPHQEMQPDGQVRERLLVDGGYTNQWPVNAVQELGAGVVLCSVACPDFDKINTDYGDTCSGGTIWLRRQFGCCGKRAASDDPPALADIQERLIFLVDAMKERSATNIKADLMLEPPL